MLHVVSTLVVVLVATGLYFLKRKPRRHIKLMITACAIDVLSVLYIELTRQAVETVIGGVSPLIWFHAGISLGVLICYGVMFWFGWRLRRGIAAVRSKHRNVGITFCVLRGVNYITSFMV